MSEKTLDSTRAGAVTTLMAGGLALGLAGLLSPVVCLCTLLLIVVAGLAVPRWTPWLVAGSTQRTWLAAGFVVLLMVVSATSAPSALSSDGLAEALASVATDLGLATGAPLALLASLAGGALVAVSLELADRRGVQSALVLAITVLGLASVAGPDRQLTIALMLGWPAALFTLTQLANLGSASSGALTTSPAGPAHSRVQLRWWLVPVLASITVACLAVELAVQTGLAGNAGQFEGWNPPGHGLGASSATGRSASEYLGGEMDLRARGALPNDPLFKVPIDSPGLWRAGTLDVYTGSGWRVTRDGLPQLHADYPGELQLRPAPGLDSAQIGAIRSDQVHSLRSGATQILAPGRLIAVTSQSLVAGSIVNAAGDRLTVVGENGGLGGYQVQSQVLPLVGDPASDRRLIAADLAQSRSPVGDAIEPGWTALPPSVPLRVRQLGIRLVSGAPSRLAAVQAIEAELHRRMTYRLDSPVPAPGVDMVDDVLFTSHTGFCEQFASAEVVLLRAAGVPARLAVGFSGGVAGSDGFRTVLRSQAHAWVEVWFPGVGWVSSDPTPAAAVSIRTWWQRALDVLPPVPSAAGFWVTLVLLIALVWSLCRLLLRRRRRITWSVGRAAAELDPDLAAAFARLEKALAAQGRGRDAHETVAALAARLPGARVDAALAVLERALYAERSPSREECLLAASAIHDALDQGQALVPEPA